MPRGPRGEKRHADVNRNAVLIAKIATGEIEDVTKNDGKNAAAAALGRMDGKARAEGMSPSAAVGQLMLRLLRVAKEVCESLGSCRFHR